MTPDHENERNDAFLQGTPFMERVMKHRRGEPCGASSCANPRCASAIEVKEVPK